MWDDAMMSREKLPRDATVASILDRLASPEDYICGALLNFKSECDRNPSSRLTIDVTGTGKYPHYRIDSEE
jgi:hypothetical protein